MNEIDQRPRSFLWLRGLLAVAIMASLALFGMLRMQLTAEERMFVGTWRQQYDGVAVGAVTFRADRTAVNQDASSTFDWSVHGNQFVYDDAGEVSWFDEAAARLVGRRPPGELLEIDGLTADRIVLSKRGMPDLILTRLVPTDTHGQK